VKAVKTGSSFTGSATTDSHGDYIIDKLETGTYRVTASLDGYVPATQTTDLSAAGDQARIDFELNKKTNP
jgi:hypothetical protein